MAAAEARIARRWLREVIDRWPDEVLAAWTVQQRSMLPGERRSDEEPLIIEARQVLDALTAALDSDLPLERLACDDPGLHGLLVALSQQRAADGTAPGGTARAVLALKQALVDVVRARARNVDGDPVEVLDVVVALNRCVDAAAVLILETQLRRRDEIIVGHQQRLMELSAPVLRAAAGVLVLPLVGTLDTARAQAVMDNVLAAVRDNQAHTVIIDVTGAVLAETAVVAHLLRVTEAATLLGARSVLCGMRPDTAQAMAALGVDLTHLQTHRSLSDAWAVATQRLPA
jgi:rsbT co-antagonist protein RsbR